MSKRNLVLLIIVLVAIGIVVFGFLYSRPATTPGVDSEGTNFLSRFNPFRKSGTVPSGNTPSGNDISEPVPDTTVGGIPAVKLKKVSGMPVAGFGLFAKERLKEIPIPTTSETVPSIPAPTTKSKTKPTPPPTEFMTAVRYVERAQGIIHQTFLDKIEEREFSTTVIPKVYEAYLGNKAKSVIMRHLKGDDKTIETFTGVLPKELLGGDTTLNNEISGSFLPDNITDISLSPDTTKIFYLFKTGDVVVGTTLNLLDNKKTQIFDSPFTEWLSSWPNSNMITLTNKPSFNMPGYMYILNPSTKSLNRTLSGINGLTTLTSPDGKLILYSDNNLSLSVYHTNTKNSDLLGIRTLPEKCVWGKANAVVYCAVPSFIDNPGLYPDSWYQGEVSFNDQIWKIDITNGNTTMISDPATVLGGGDIDGIKLALDDGEKYLLFINKKDSYLWQLELK